MKYFIALLLVAAVQGEVIRVIKCTMSGKLHSVEVNPCPRVPCILHKGGDKEIKIVFTPKDDITNLKIRMTGKVGPIWVPFPGGPTEGCVDSGIACPLKGGQTYTFVKKVKVSASFPSITLPISIQLQDDDLNNAVCIMFPVKLR